MATPAFHPRKLGGTAFTAFDTLVRPIYVPGGAVSATCGFLADERHANRRGVVHGGMICTAFDVGLGTTSRVASAPPQLAVQFVSGMMLGDFCRHPVGSYPRNAHHHLRARRRDGRSVHRHARERS